MKKPAPRPPEINDLLSALQQYGSAPTKRPAGPGWWTVAELAEKEQTTGPAIRYRIKMLRRRGIRLESVTGSVLDDEGLLKRTTYYRIRKKKA